MTSRPADLPIAQGAGKAKHKGIENDPKASPQGKAFEATNLVADPDQ